MKESTINTVLEFFSIQEQIEFFELLQKYPEIEVYFEQNFITKKNLLQTRDKEGIKALIREETKVLSEKIDAAELENVRSKIKE